MAAKPSKALIALVFAAAAAAMSAGVYFGGTGRTLPAMIGTVVFVALGGFGFELARRRSL